MSKTSELTHADFLRSVEHHELTILRDDGLHRHLQFSKPGTYCMGFDIITWPGHLCYTGDMGTYVFQRLDDMLQFFRTGGERINPGYWSEKLRATSCNGRHCTHGATEFDRDVVVDRIKRWRLEWIKDAHREGILTKGERRELWEAVSDDVLSQSDEMEQVFCSAIHDFSWRRFFRRDDKGENPFEFTDFFDSYPERFTREFLWCCHALSWGIDLYDKATPEKPAT